MNKTLAAAALALAAPGIAAASMPALAAPVSHTTAPSAATGAVSANAQDRWERDERNGRYDGYRGRGVDRSGYRDERVSRDTRVWRDDDGRYRCRRGDGTTGLLVGGAVGGLLGNGIAGRGDRTLGTILGVAGGALLGREVDRSNSRCR
ncbi:MAG: hypothetical protein JWQ16_1018 [Novosphingobium sp.]|nr:hypothetical protein [Novosphingobium sp.]